jgi:tetratricopeptide (TPR) repeat protein
MSESTQPSVPLKEDTQPIKPIKPAPRWRSNLLNLLGVLVLLGLSLFGGYSAALADRQNAEFAIVHTQLSEQYQFALVDIQFGRYEAAKQRLDFIIAHDPNYPGASEALTQVLVAMSVPTATSTPVPTPTANPSGAEAIFSTAQQLIAAGDWVNALVALDEVRRADPNFRTAQVDGMYYFALRQHGYSLIVNQGNLEGGIYHLTLAERFGPLDNTANGLREGARAYITASSFWEANWEQAVVYLGQVYNGWPSMWDGTMNAAQRYHIALMRYGDELFEQNRFCDAYAQYDTAQRIASLDENAQKGWNQSFQQCYPATETPLPTSEASPTSSEPTIEPTPTETPTPGA